MSRIEPLRPPYDAVVKRQLEQMMPAGVAPIALFRTFAKNMRMTRAMHAWGAYQLGRDLTLPLRDREIIIDRTCARTGCEYEWGVHVAFFATCAGITDAELSSLAHGQSTDSCWISTRDRLLIRAVDALHDLDDIPDALWSELAVIFDETQLLDLLLLAGWYHAISYVARAARLPLESGSPTFASYAHVDRSMPQTQPGESSTACARRPPARQPDESGL